MVTKEKTSLWVYTRHDIFIALQKAQINLTVYV